MTYSGTKKRWQLLVVLSLVLAFQSHAQVYVLEDKKPEKMYLPGEIDPTESNGAWVLFLGSTAKQEAQDFTPGYRVNTAGIGVGKDWISNSNGFLGFGVRFDAADVNSTHIQGTDLDATSRRLFAYGRYDFNDRWFLNALVAYAFNDYNTQRTVQVPTIAPNRINIHGDFTGRQWSFLAETGYQYSNHKWQFLPIASLEYDRLSTRAYTELGVPGLNQHFDSQTYNAFKISLDGVIAYQNEFPLAQLLPYVHARVSYDSDKEASERTAEALGGATLFPTFGFKPSSTSYQVGAGFTVFGQNNIQISMRYDYTFKHRYFEHQALIYVRHEW